MSEIKDEVKYVPTPQQIALTKATEKELEKKVIISHHTEMAIEMKAAFFDKESAMLLGMIPFCVGTEQEIIYGCLPTMKFRSTTVASCTSFDILLRKKAGEPIRLMTMHSICNSGLDGISEDFKVVWAYLSGAIDVDVGDAGIHCDPWYLNDDVSHEGTKDKHLKISAENLYQRLIYLDYFGAGEGHAFTNIIVHFLVMLLIRDGADVEMIRKIQKFCGESDRENLAAMLPEAERISYILGALPDEFEEVKENLLKLHESKATHLQINWIRPKPVLLKLGELKEMTLEDVTGVNILRYARWWVKHESPMAYSYTRNVQMDSKTHMYDELVYLFYTRAIYDCQFDENKFNDIHIDFGDRIIKSFDETNMNIYKFKVYKVEIQGEEYLLVHHPGLKSLRSGDVTRSKPLWILLNQTLTGVKPYFLTDTDKYTIRLLKSKPT